MGASHCAAVIAVAAVLAFGATPLTAVAAAGGHDGGDITVHIIPHSHCDLGWLDTAEVSRNHSSCGVCSGACVRGQLRARVVLPDSSDYPVLLTVLFQARREPHLVHDS